MQNKIGWGNLCEAIEKFTLHGAICHVGILDIDGVHDLEDKGTV